MHLPRILGLNLLLAVGAGILGTLRADVSPRTEPVIGGPCEGCEWVYEGMPTQLEAVAMIADRQEPGTRLAIHGTVRNRAGKPAAGVIVYAYHTNAQGLYPRGPNRHGRLRGWARTDASGTYRFETIRPAAYPTHDEPAHVHLHVIEPGKGTYYLEDIWFTDDPLVTDAHRHSPRPRGGPGITTPRKDPAGVWQVRRDIFLGENIPGY